MAFCRGAPSTIAAASAASKPLAAYDLIEELREPYEASRVRRLSPIPSEGSTPERARSNSEGDRSISERDRDTTRRSGAA